MSKPTPRKDRLEELLALARTYRGWTQKQLADALGRDVHNLVPGGGVPRLDMVLRLAESLDWPVETVIADLCGQTPEPSKIPDENATWIELDRAAYAAAMEGRVADQLVLAGRAYAVAQSPRERAYSSLRESGALDQLGRYSASAEAARRGLRELDIPPVVYADLKAALANAYLMLGELVEGEAIAASLATELRLPRFSGVYAGVRGYVHYLLGMSHRALAITDWSEASPCASVAATNFETAIAILREYYGEAKSSVHLNAALISEAALIEMKVILGLLNWTDAVDRLLARIDDPGTSHELPEACIESIGWACVFGSQLVLAHATDDEFAERHLAIFTNKADEVARRSGSWALRERIWALEYLLMRGNRLLEPSTAVLDPEDLRDLTGTMGRFPSFRPHGWSLLRNARRVGEE